MVAPHSWQTDLHIYFSLKLAITSLIPLGRDPSIGLIPKYDGPMGTMNMTRYPIIKRLGMGHNWTLVESWHHNSFVPLESTHTIKRGARHLAIS